MTKPWDRRKTESLPAWTAFVVYRDLGPERTHRAAIEASGRPPGSLRLFEEWSSKHEWVARVAAYDAAIDARVQERVMRDRTEASLRRLNLARGLQSVAGLGLKELLGADGKTLRTPLDPKEVASLAKAGAEMERLEDGDPTAIMRHEGGMNLEIRVVDVKALPRLVPEDEDEEDS